MFWPKAGRRQASSICATSDPTVAQDIRYAGSNNFVGHPLPEDWLSRQMRFPAGRGVGAQAGAGRSRCRWPRTVGRPDFYRPTQAVSAMVRWAYDHTQATSPTKQFFPSGAEEFAVRARLSRIGVAALDRDRSRPDVDRCVGSASSAVQSVSILPGPVSRRSPSARPTMDLIWEPATTVSIRTAIRAARR